MPWQLQQAKQQTIFQVKRFIFSLFQYSLTQDRQKNTREKVSNSRTNLSHKQKLIRFMIHISEKRFSKKDEHHVTESDFFAFRNFHNQIHPVNSAYKIIKLFKPPGNLCKWVLIMNVKKLCFCDEWFCSYNRTQRLLGFFLN